MRSTSPTRRKSTASFADIFEHHGRLDVLVNSAGIAIRKPAVELPLADWERVMAVNATGSFLCARAAARHMLEGDGGRIVNIASIMVSRAASIPTSPTRPRRARW